MVWCKHLRLWTKTWSLLKSCWRDWEDMKQEAAKRGRFGSMVLEPADRRPVPEAGREQLTTTGYDSV